MKKYFAGLMVAFLTSPAYAAIDGTAVATEIEANAVGLALIGAAILSVVYGVRAFSWAKKI